MTRFYQLLLIGSSLTLGVLLMQVVHESGHVLAAWASGGQVKQVVLHPLTFSRTDLAENPHPLVVVAAGPLFGVLFPLILYGVVRWLRFQIDYLFRFFAGFCLVVNGAYIAFGPDVGHVDSAELLRHGAARWMLVFFGLVTIPAGIALWHNLGPRFGLGPTAGKVDRPTAVACAGMLVLVIVIELVFS